MTRFIRLPWLRWAGALLLFVAVATSAGAAEDALAGDLKKLQGKWKANVAMDHGNTVWKLEIKGNKATIIVESEDGETQFKGEMDFKLEQQGKLKAYTYSNLKILAGSSEGETRYTGGDTKSSAYRFYDDQWITVGGLRADDDEKPRLVTWSRP